MKNRLLRIRISQALPHCIGVSRAEWWMVCACACVCAYSLVVCSLQKHAWYLGGNCLPFLITVWSGMWIPWSSTDYDTHAGKRGGKDNFSTKAGNISASDPCQWTHLAVLNARTKPDTISRHHHPTWRLSRPIPVIIVHDCFQRGYTDGRITQITKSDLNNEAVSPHNPDLISPSYWLYTHKETSNLDWIVITAAHPIKGLWTN